MLNNMENEFDIRPIQNRFAKESKKGIHSQLHQLVDEMRKEFKETATKGKGSFSFYLGYFNKIGVGEIYRIRAEIKDSVGYIPKKLFWWKIGEELKRRKRIMSRE